MGHPDSRRKKSIDMLDDVSGKAQENMLPRRSMTSLTFDSELMPVLLNRYVNRLDARERLALQGEVA